LTAHDWPMITPSLTPTAPTRVTLPVRASTRILVVADDEFTAAVLAEHFEAPEFQVEMADGEADALRKIRRFPPDLMVVDATMPGLDHWDFPNWCRLDGRTDSTPIVALSTRDQLSDVVARDGVWVCLVKPVEVEVLVGAVHRIARFCNPSN
jgi:DNA-binding response OmpR family regulator